MAYAIAIDMGGTKIEGSIVSDKGKILKTLRHPTEASKGKKKMFDNLVKVIDDIKKDWGKPVEGIGISIAGFVDHEGTLVYGGGTIYPMVGTKIKKLLEKKFKLPVYIENDANCFAMAEAEFGAGKGHDVVIGVIWGTGIGAGIIYDGKVFSGSFGGAGEFGHVVVDHNVRSGKTCACGQKGCLEIIASGKNIERLYKQRGGKIKDATVKEIYRSKEPLARDVINNAAYFLGLGLSYLVDIINPDIIVLGGGVSKLPEDIYRVIRSSTKHFALPLLGKKLKIVRHKISDSAGTLGAAALVFEGEEK